MTRPEDIDERILVLAPTANDGPLTVRLLASAGFAAALVRDVRALCAAAREGAGAVLVAEEALSPAEAAAPLKELLRDQEPWSDLPILLFTARRREGAPGRGTTADALAPLGNVTLVDRPVQVVTLVSAVRAALRGRRRQYQIGRLLAERERAARALRESEAALRESDRRKTEFLGVLSHELRNPLAPIRNGIYILEHGPQDGERARRAREVIARQTDHLARLVDDLLDVTRISRGKISLQRHVVDVAEVVRRTCEDHRTLLEARGLALRLDLAGPAWVDADATRLAQVVGNLLQNAAKFSRAGGAVAVTVVVRDAVVELRIRDDGVGIAPELLPRLFEPFVQADGGLSRASGGLGLGLALVKGIVELHGGTVRALSEGEARGTELVVALPRSREPGRPRSERPSRAAAGSRLVLVIDDNVDAAHTVAEMLSLEGHRVHVAVDGRSGLATARAVRPEVILCDIGLPDVDGYEIARAVRADAALSGTRLVAVSGYGLPSDRERARSAGFDAHLVKPASADELLGILATDRA